MQFLNFISPLVIDNWLSFLLLLLVIIYLYKNISKIRTTYFSFISIFIIPGTVSFIALAILLTHFYRNDFRADDQIIKLLALIIASFYLPTFINLVVELFSRIINFKSPVGEFVFGNTPIFQSPSGQSSPSDTDPLIKEKTIGNLNHYLYSLWGGLTTKMVNVFKLIYINEQVPQNMNDLLNKLNESGKLDQAIYDIINILNNFSNWLQAGNVPSNENLNTAIEYTKHAIEFFEQKENEESQGQA